MKKIIFLVVVFTITKSLFAQGSENTLADFRNYDFKAGETILFEDLVTNQELGKSPNLWKMEGGKASIVSEKDGNCISILEYYTIMRPNLSPKYLLPDSFSIEYDTWLEAGYDGNPGVQIHLKNGEQEIVITPNKHHTIVDFPQDGKENGDMPEDISGDKFYNKWNHISISFFGKSLNVYVNQFKVVTVEDCRLKPKTLELTGNTSGEMKILFKNFKLAKGFRKTLFENGKFVTRAIKFDVNKANIKPESMSVINELVTYLKSNTTNIEISGHTDSDGKDDDNLILSQKRAEAVMNELVKLGIDAKRLKAIGCGESKPIADNVNLEGKSLNRRVEFIIK